MFDVMVDLETASTSTHAAVFSIGAVAFDPNGSLAEDVRQIPGERCFSLNVDLQSCIDLGCDVSGDTIYWWLRQAEAARLALVNPPPVPVEYAMTRFIAFLSDNMSGNDCLWSNGADFDVPIVQELARKLKLDFPVKFWNIEHTRSVYKLAGVRLPRADHRPGGHNSLFDAIIQARYVQQSLQLIRSNSAILALDKRL
jgi:hypothetical protein